METHYLMEILFFYPTYMNGGGYSNDLDSGLVGVTDGNGSYHESATFIDNSNASNVEIRAASNSSENGGEDEVPGPVGLTDDNGSFHGNAMFSTENGGDVEVIASVITKVPNCMINGALFS
ncbi:hypothetical protein LOK49_LG01G03123 [Camellia lanceoleosa]|uniref:Uncharacterized protein n=1 Tax=Camellia lanceoleosa TaxID=1840588 RepID=A0ACC0IV07_9ERIC|nr:hypothetical protein LOK49_LG01G03123 [Camellia lanceoleosa]